MDGEETSGVEGKMTIPEAKKLVIDAMNYAAYKETQHSLYTSDKNRLFGADHYRSELLSFEPSPWEADFEREMCDLLRWAAMLQRSDASFAQAVRVLQHSSEYLGTLIRRSSIVE